MPTWPKTFRDRVVSQMLAPDAVTLRTLSEELGVPIQTLSRWRTQALHAKVSGNGSSTDTPPIDKRPDERPPTEKLRLLVEAAGLGDDELGEFLRREGIHEAQLERWREAAMEGLDQTAKSGRSKQSRRLRALEREVRRRDKALAETTALLVLRKEAHLIWGDGDDDT